MPRICEVCGRVDDVNHEEFPYEILDVCPDCSDHLIHPTHEHEE
ncbi:hypothetical protein GCM10008986_24420 [Salinibacillus aidingensis]|uniref:Small CPxCG-related zinc finger protein n=1 Tax=Salinibacillus aidingensis TaxID=237684 RepID=A0ABN1BFD2_9BACI|nr:hypothetical protein [Virgibacillus sp. MSP4-1]